MKDLIIVGASGLGREVLQMCLEINGLTNCWNIKGFIDDNLHALDNIESRYQVLGSIKDWQPKENEVFVFAIAAPRIKEKNVNSMLQKGAKFETVISPRAFIADNAQIGQGVVISPFCYISCNTKIGDFAFCNAYTSIGHDTEIGAYTSTMGHVDITGCCKVGIGTYWGSGARALPSSKIGNYAKVGAGSVVLKKVKENTTVFGNPSIEI